MAKLFDRVKFETSSSGTGAITVGNAADGYQTPIGANVRIGDVVRYVIETSGNDWEIGTARFGIDYDTGDDYDPVTEIGNYLNALAYSADGTKLYISSNSSIYQYSLSTAYDPSTASYDSKSLAAGNIGSLFFKPDGTKVFVTLAGAMNIQAYELSTAWDISTAGSVITQGGSSSSSYYVKCAEWNSDGTKLFVHVYASHNSSIPDQIHQFNATTAYDHTWTSIGNGGAEDATVEIEGDFPQITAPIKFSWNADGSRLFVAETDKVHRFATSQYNLNNLEYQFEAIDVSDLYSVRAIHVEDNDNILIGAWTAYQDIIVKKYNTDATPNSSYIQRTSGSVTESSQGQSRLDLTGTNDVFLSVAAEDLLTSDGIELENSATMKFGDNLEIDYEGTLYPKIVNRNTSTSLRAKQGFIFSNEDNTITYAYIGTGSNDGATLFYNDGAKLATIATGIDIYGSDIVFEGTTSDAYETTVTVVDPTADQTVTIPDQTGTVMLWQNEWPDDPTDNGQNYAIGKDAGSSLGTSGNAYGNIFFGREAGRDVDNTSNNIGIGDYAGSEIVTGYANIAIGRSALQGGASTSGIVSNYNIGIGMYALQYVADNAGGKNIGIGYNSGKNNDGQLNIFIGHETEGAADVQGSIAIGYQAQVGQNYTTAIGYDTGSTNTGDNSTFVGAFAGRYNTTAGYRTYVGYNAGSNNFGEYSTAVGANAMRYSRAYMGTAVGYQAHGRSSQWYPYYNVAVGGYAGDGVYSGDYNTFAGYGANALSNSGNYNCAFGTYARTGPWSVSVGYQAQYSGNSGSNYVVAVGARAGYDMDGGDHCTFVGHQAGYEGGTGSYNTHVGSGTAYKLTSGAYNTTCGMEAAFNLSSGSNNTMVGYRAGNNTSSASENTFVGRQSGYGASSNTSAQNTALGSNSLYGLNGGGYNTAAGVEALQNTTSGGNNTALGYRAGKSNSSGGYNVYLGNEAGYNSTTDSTSYHNLGMGYRALAQITTGSYNIGLGRETFYATTDGENNTAVGSYAAKGMKYGDRNVALGWHTMEGVNTSTNVSDCVAAGSYALANTTSGDRCVALGAESLRKVTTGQENVAVGYRAGYLITTGINNTYVGHEAGYFGGFGDQTGSNNTSIGHQAAPSQLTDSNKVTLGNSSVDALRCNVQTISSLSDERDKTAIEDLPYGLDFINDMRPVQFTWNRRDGSYGARPDMGFIAQELGEVEVNHSSASRTRLVKWDNPSKLEADYVRSYPILVKAVQELSAKCDALEARLAQLEGA